METALDRELEPAVLAGEFRLVLITGNAGDGKTAFLQQLEKRAEDRQAILDTPLPNGRRFTLRGRTFLTNYDGSQDEGEQTSDDVLGAFLAPFAGSDPAAWPSDEVHLIAINEGRLVDFLSANSARFPLLDQVVRAGLVTGSAEHGVAVVNLNLRSVVHDLLGYDSDEGDGDESIFARTLRRLTHDRFWEPCESCDLRDRCYAFHNARTFQDPDGGPEGAEAPQEHLHAHASARTPAYHAARPALGACVHAGRYARLRADPRALPGGRSRRDRAELLLQQLDGRRPADRVIACSTLLKDVDVAEVDDPRLDRGLDFVSPTEDRTLFRFERRGNYDRDVLRSLYEELPRDFSGHPTGQRSEVHQRYVAMARRRAFFERRDGGWRQMLPYRSAERMMRLITRRSGPRWPRGRCAARDQSGRRAQ